jgi:hypothetical protein
MATYRWNGEYEIFCRKALSISEYIPGSILGTPITTSGYHFILRAAQSDFNLVPAQEEVRD